MRATIIACLLLLVAFAAILPAAAIRGSIHDRDVRPRKDVAVRAADLSLKTFSDERGEFALEPTAPMQSIRLVFEAPWHTF